MPLQTQTILEETTSNPLPIDAPIDTGIQLAPYNYDNNFREFEMDYFPDFNDTQTKIIPKREALDKAYYTTGAYSINPVEEFTQIYEDLIKTGESSSIDAANKAWQSEQDIQTKQAISAIVSDQTISKQEKIQILNNYSIGHYLSKDIKDKYIQRAASLELGTNEADIESQDANINNLTFNLDVIKNKKENYNAEKVIDTIFNSFSSGSNYANPNASLEDLKKDLLPFLDKDLVKSGVKLYLENTGDFSKINYIAEGISALNVIATLPQFTLATLSTVEQAALDKIYKEKINWKLAREESEKNTNFLTPELLLRKLVTKMGFIEEFDAAWEGVKKDIPDTAVNKAFELLGEAIDYSSQKAEDYGIMEKDAAKTMIDVAMLTAPFVKKTYKAIRPTDPTKILNDLIQNIENEALKKQTVVDIIKTSDGTSNPLTIETLDPITGKPILKDKKDLTGFNQDPDSPLTNTLAANPKLAETLIIGALKDPTEKTADILGSSKASLIEDFVFSKIEKEIDISNNVDLKSFLNKITDKFKDSLNDMLFDENVMNKSERLADLELLNKIKNDMDGYYNQSLSLFQPFLDSTNGTMVFTKDATTHYGVYDAINQYNKLLEHTKNLPKKEQGTIAIVDKLTRRKYTPKTILSVSEFATNELGMQGTQATNRLSVEWNYQKKYDVLSPMIDSLDSVGGRWKLSAALAKGPFGGFFFYTGRYPSWFEAGLANNAMKKSYLTINIMKNIQSTISKSLYKSELLTLIELSESEGRRKGYSRKELGQLFPKIAGNVKALDTLVMTHALWRKVNEFNYHAANLKLHKILNDEGYKSYLYVNNEKHGIVNDNISLFPSMKDFPITIWDFDTNLSVPFNLYKEHNLTGTYHWDGVMPRKVVRFRNPKEYKNSSNGNKEVYDYGLLGKTAVTDKLPQEVLPNTPGYSPVLTLGHWFVEATPLELTINGIKNTSLEKLENYKRVLGTAKNSYEAGIIKTEFEKRYVKDELLSDGTTFLKKTHRIEIRPAKENSWPDAEATFESHDAVLRNSLKRNERMVTINNGKFAPANVEDRFKTLANTTNSLIDLNVFDSWERTFKASFVKDFSRYLPTTNGDFPANRSLITPLKDATVEQKNKYKAALGAFDRYALTKMSTNLVSNVWRSTFHFVADIFENSKVTRLLAPLTRDVANKANTIEGFPRKIASALLISLQLPMRHWMIQPQTAVEMAAINPIHALKVAKLLPFVLADLFKESLLFETHKKSIDIVNEYLSEHAKEAKIIANAVRKSGLIESIDHNLMVDGLFTEGAVSLVEGKVSKGVSIVSNKLFGRADALHNIPVKAGSVVKVAGFTVSELLNRLSLYMIIKEDWVSKNPGKNWNTPEVLAKINFDSWKLSGAMTKEGSFRYQNMSIINTLTQFDSINHKFFMNMFQQDAVPLSKAQRIRLTVARLAMYGKYGVPLGLGVAIVDELRSNNTNEAVQDALDWIDSGAIMDIAYDRILDPLDKEENSLSFSSSLSPYGSKVGGFIYDYIATAALFFGYKLQEDGTNKYPVQERLGKIADTIRQVNLAWASNPITPDNIQKMIEQTLSITSGFSNYNKVKIIEAINDKENAMGKKYGLVLNNTDRLAAYAGVKSNQELDQFKVINGSIHNKEDNKLMANDISKMIHFMGLDKDGYSKVQLYLPATKAFLLDSGFSGDDVDDIWNQVLQNEAKKGISNQEGLINHFLLHATDVSEKEYIRFKNYMRTTKNPGHIKLLNDIEKLREGK